MIREDIDALSNEFSDVVLRYRVGAKVEEDSAVALATDLVDTGTDLLASVGTVTRPGVDRFDVTADDVREVMDAGALLRDCGSKLIQLVKQRRGLRRCDTTAKPAKRATGRPVRDSKAIWKAMSEEERQAEWLRRGNLYFMRQQNLTSETTPLEALELAEAKQAEEARERAEQARQEQALANFDAMGFSPLSSWLTQDETQAQIHDLAEKDAIGRGIKLGERW